MARNQRSPSGRSARWPGTPWLRPLAPSLTPPGGAMLRTLEGHTAGVWALAVTPDGQRALSTSAGGTLRLWDLESGQTVTSFYRERALHAYAVAPDGRTFVAGGASGQVNVLRLEGRERTKGIV